MGKKGTVRRSPEEQAKAMREKADLMEAAGHLRVAAQAARKGDATGMNEAIAKAKLKSKG
jgi:hypothetical protein